jgi:hypothetical protein
MEIATWNMSYWQHKAMHQQAWKLFLNEIKADFFFFQEGRPIADDDDDEHLVWQEIGADVPGELAYTARHSSWLKKKSRLDLLGNPPRV